MYKNVINNNLIRDMLSTENCHLSVCIMIYKNKSKLIKHIKKSIKNQKLNNKSEFIIDIGDSEKIHENIIDFGFDFNDIIENIEYLIVSNAKYSLNCNKVKFNYEVYFTGIELKGEVDFSGACFEKDVNFNSIIFKDKIYFSDAIINSEINFINSYFYKEINFVSSIINGIANFETPSFMGNITFAKSIINKISINNMVMSNKSDLFFSYTSFNNNASTIEIISNSNNVEDENSYINQLYFTDLNIKGMINIKNINTNIVDFKGSVINGGLVNPVKFKVNNFANRESALFLKNEAYARNNIIDALEYKSKEIDLYRKNLKKELLEEKNYKKLGDIISIELSSLYSNNGLNWLKSFFLTLIIPFIFFTFTYIPIGLLISGYMFLFISSLFIFYGIKNIIKDYLFWIFIITLIFGFIPKIYYTINNKNIFFIKELFIFFIPTEFTKIKSYCSNDNIILTILIMISYFLGKIAFWYGSVQTIQAFRKFGKGA